MKFPLPIDVSIDSLSYNILKAATSRHVTSTEASFRRLLEVFCKRRFKRQSDVRSVIGRSWFQLCHLYFNFVICSFGSELSKHINL